MADVFSLDSYRTEQWVDERPSMCTFVCQAGPYDRSFKRVFDIIAASILLVVLAPLIATVALAVRLTMGSKVLFFQERIGRGSRAFRRWSLEELPQLFNVLRGHMSLVGPRPELVQVAMRHGLIDHPRHLVRPGITGRWQVSDSRSSLLHENVHIDLDYVRKVTLVSDVKILLCTFGSVVKVRGS